MSAPTLQIPVDRAATWMATRGLGSGPIASVRARPARVLDGVAITRQVLGG